MKQSYLFRHFMIWSAMAVILILAGCPNPAGSDPSSDPEPDGGAEETPDSETEEGNDVDTYSVTYDANGASDGAPPEDSAEYESGVVVTVLGNTGNPELQKDDHTFAGWNTQADGEGTNYSEGNTFPMGDADITLYARWVEASVATFTVTFDSDGGSAVAAQTVVDGETANEPSPPPTRTGYGFDGWNDNGSAYNFDDPVAADPTLTAQWTANDYDIVFDNNGGSGSMANQTLTFDTSDNLSPNGFTRLGHSFDGWNTESGGGGTSYADEASFTMIVEGITLYAQWSANDYDVVFDANGGTGSMAAQTITFGTTETLSANTFTREDFTFTGWNTDADGNGTAYADGASFSMSTEGVTLYAQWTEDEPTVDRTTVEVTGLGSDYNGFVGVVVVFEAGSEFPEDGFTAFNEATAVGEDDGSDGAVNVTGGGFGPVFLESYDESEDEYFDFVGQGETDYDLYLMVAMSPIRETSYPARGNEAR